MGNNSKKMRFVLWTGVLGIMVGMLGISVAESEAWLRFFDNLHWTFSTAAAALWCWLAIRSSKAHDLACWWFATGMSAYAIGQIIWDFQQWLGFTGFPTLPDMFYLWLGPCLVIGLVRLVSQRAYVNQLSFFSLDSVMVMVVAVALMAVFYLPKNGNMDFVSMAVLIAYPASLMTSFGVGVLVLLTLHLRLTLAWAAFLLAVLITTCSWMIWNNLALDGQTKPGAWFNSAFSISILALAVSASRLEIHPCQGQYWIRLYEAVLRLLPLFAVMLVSAAVIATLVIVSMPAIVVNVIWSSGVLIVILATFRQYATLCEYDRLSMAERALDQERQLLNTIVESLPGAFVLLNQHGRILKHNSYIAHFMNSHDDGPEPFFKQALIRPEYRAEFERELDQVLAAGYVAFEQPLYSAGRKDIMHRFSFKRIVFENATYLMGIGIDISTLNQALLAAEESRNLLQQVVDTLPLRVF